MSIGTAETYRPLKSPEGIADALAVGQNWREEIARGSRGTPRVANRLLRRVRDYAQKITAEAIAAAVGEKPDTIADVVEPYLCICIFVILIKHSRKNIADNISNMGSTGNR